MILSLAQAADAWDAIRGAIRGFGGVSAGPVLIFCASPDPDALAAARTLTSLLKADLVRYELHPVGSYTHLQKRFDSIVRGKIPIHPRAVLCINCGAGVDLATLLGLAPKLDQSDEESQEETDDSDVARVFVLDSHRPYHLRNISSDRVFIFDDSPDAFDSSVLPLDVGWEDVWGNVSEIESSSSSSEDDRNTESDSSGEDITDTESNTEDREARGVSSHDNTSERDEQLDATGTARNKKRRTERQLKQRTESSPLDTDSENDSLDDESQHSSVENTSTKNVRGKRKRVVGQKGRSRRRRARHYTDQQNPEVSEKRVLREYYAAVTSGMASACIAHNLAQGLRRANFDTLWAGIIGITHQYLSASIQNSVYDDAIEYCKAQSALLAPADTSSENIQTANSNSSHGRTYAQKCNDAVAADRICYSAEFKLDLVRHWNLHDSLLYSVYTTTRMAAWRQVGRRRLMELLATLGIPIKESRQKWCYMKAECKAALEDRLVPAMRRFGLGKDVQYNSFIRVLPGFRGKISASDVVHGLSALLELNVVDTAGNHLRLGEFMTDAQISDSDLERRFWRAYDAIDRQRMDVLCSGLELAIASQKLIVEIGGEIVERRRFVPSGPFRYVFLRDVHSKELFAHPLLLKRLAMFLIEAVTRQGGRHKPFVAIAPNPSRNIWLAVAATNAGARNDFGHRFRQAAEKNGSTITFDGFDSAVCEIKDGHETEFIRYLHDCMI